MKKVTEILGVSPESVQIIQEMNRLATAYDAQQEKARREIMREQLRGKSDYRSKRARFLTFCREATADERKEYVRIGQGKSRETSHTVYVLVERPDVVPSLYGANSVRVLVHKAVDFHPDNLPKTFHGACGHSVFAFEKSGEVIGG